MKKIPRLVPFVLLAAFFLCDPIAFALEGQIGIHDPSTIVFCDGKYYTYGTGGTSLVSDDGWTWRQGARLPRRSNSPWKDSLSAAGPFDAARQEVDRQARPEQEDREDRQQEARPAPAAASSRASANRS